MKYSLIASIATFASFATAIDVYGQCGGKDWKGSGTCAAGSTCVKSDDYYSQCLPGSASSGSGGSPGTTLSTKTTSGSASPTSSGSGSAGSSPVVTGSAGNIFSGKQIYANPYYASEISSLAVPSLTGTLKSKATDVAKVGTFVWLDTAAKVPTMETYLTNIEALNKAGASPEIIAAFVVYDLPDRDCAAYSSNGEYSIADGGAAKYKAYIDSIAAIIKKHPNTKIALVIEPDSLPNLVTNLSVQKCSNAKQVYTDSVTYAIKTLNFNNVAQYMDAGHAGWLGWSANLDPAAKLFAQVYKAAGSPASVKGLATNVANYNAFSISTCPSYTQGDANCDENRYINAMGPALASAGWSGAHFIVDTSRNGVQPTSQQAWGDWCNVAGTGFGVRPTTSTGNSLVDAFVWVKPGGESDGTSDSSATRYDTHCGLSDALKPAPEAGTWFQAYFAQLLTNASPSF